MGKGDGPSIPDFSSFSEYVCVFFFFSFFFRVSSDSPYLLEDPVLMTIAKKHNQTPGQVALRYQLQRGVVVLAKSFNEKRIKENFQVKAQDHLSRMRHRGIFLQMGVPAIHSSRCLASECHRHMASVCLRRQQRKYRVKGWVLLPLH